MFAGHWFPYTRVTGGKRLHPLLSYTYGTSVIMVTATFATWYASDNSDTWIQYASYFWLATMGAGAATLAAWIIDAITEHLHRLQDRVDRAELQD